jgi:AcrR family transcriptional regulator
MSNDSARRVREPGAIDPRVMRSTHALGHALVELVQERDFDEITVQQILDRAGVGRATFYAHYRNKEDVLHSSYERMLESMERLLDRVSSHGGRLFPVAEFLSHVGEQRALLQSLQASRRMDEMWSMCIEYATRVIVRRVRLSPSAPDAQSALVARMLAGALVASTQWWLDHPTAATPAQVDRAFHCLAHAVAGANPGLVARTAER